MNCLRKVTYFLSATLIAFALFNGAAVAQQITATVSGTISDPNGAVVPGATVTALSKETGQTKTAITNDDGNYTITFLPP